MGGVPDCKKSALPAWKDGCTSGREDGVTERRISQLQAVTRGKGTPSYGGGVAGQTLTLVWIVNLGTSSFRRAPRKPTGNDGCQVLYVPCMGLINASLKCVRMCMV